MFSTSTQKRCWTFASSSDLDELRGQANSRHITRYRPLLADKNRSEDENLFLNPSEEILLCRVVMDPALKFGDEFQPALWPSVRWTAFTYFKRFYLRQSVMEYYPKPLMMVCYWLAAKTDEFSISIDSFVNNLRTGTRESNIETILTLEPELMYHLDYQLVVHTPYRPFEGHLIDVKVRCRHEDAFMDFDADAVRTRAHEFFAQALLTDVMFLYSPTQISLAGLKYGLARTLGGGTRHAAQFLRNYLISLLMEDSGGGGDNSIVGMMLDTKTALHVDKLELAVDKICELVDEQSMPVDPAQCEQLKKRMAAMAKLTDELGPALKQMEKEQREKEKQEKKLSGFDSDDDF